MLRLAQLSLALVLCTFVPAAEIRYQQGGLINLATVRGVQATASGNLNSDVTPGLVLHRIEDEIRYRSDYGACWWMMELPQAYRISDLRVSCRDVIASLGYTVKVAEKAPADWAAVKPVGTFLGPLVEHMAACSFPPVAARFVRIEFSGHNGGERGEPGKNHSDLVVSAIQAWGPNDVAVTPAISIAQAVWAGGSCSWHDCRVDERRGDGSIIAHPPRDCRELIDDNDSRSPRFGDYGFSYYAPGSVENEEQTATPASLVVTLKHRSRVEAVAYAAMPRRREDRPRDVAVYISPEEIGDNWIKQVERRDIAGGEYEEFAFAAPVVAKRVRFSIERVWNKNINSGHRAAEGRLAELYVYGTALPPDFTFTVDQACQVGCQILDQQGRGVRSFIAKPYPTGTHGIEWDGLDDVGKRLPPGEYRWRALLNPAKYLTVGAIGNTAQPPTSNLNPSDIESVAVDAAGDVYTANLWEEQAQDFRKLRASDGNHIYNSRASIRNGEPNALPYAIAVDEKYFYCATTSHNNKAQQHIRRFNIADGSAAPFPAGDKHGHLLVWESPERQIPAGTPEADAELMRSPLSALASTGDRLYVVDALGGRILAYDANSGASAGSFPVKLPHSLAVDARGQLWVGHEHGTVSVFDRDGKRATVALSGLGHVRALAFGPQDRLYVADSVANQVRIYRADTQARSARSERIFGQPAKLGDHLPDRFYKLTGLAVDKQGNLIVSQGLPVLGSRLVRFAPDGKVLWDQLGGEFCNNGTYSSERPDEFITHYFHRYQLDRKTGRWSFRGCVLDGDPKWIVWQQGNMRMQKLGDQEFIFQGYKTGLQVYRREGEFYRLVSMFSAGNPMPDGVFMDKLSEEERKPRKVGLWSWHDADGDGQVDDAEITWSKQPESGFGFANFGINVDRQGNALYCDYNNEVTEVPMTGLDERGNPTYDWAKRRIIVPRSTDEKPMLSDPIMAVRADDGSLYVHSRSKVHLPPAESGGGWMAGWMLSRYDQHGKLLWYTPLPAACPGMDVIPGGGGVMLVTIKWWSEQGSPIYHVDENGLLIGKMTVDEAFRGDGGIPDNTASLVVNRDPRDGLLDVFVEDCLGNRIRWQRVDDRKKPQVVSGTVMLRAFDGK